MVPLFGRERDRLRRELAALRSDAERGRLLVEESRDLVVVVDEDNRVIAASRRAREALDWLAERATVPDEVLRPRDRPRPLTVEYAVDGRREALLYLSKRGSEAAYEELRAGFTGAVSHELRTPLARLLALLESALLPGSDMVELVEHARSEVEHMRQLIDDVLFLSELETGQAGAAVSPTPALPVVAEVIEAVAADAARAGVVLRCDGDPGVALPLPGGLIRMVAENLLRNTISHAGPGSTSTLTVSRNGPEAVLAARDDGIGVAEEHLPRLFERFYRGDRARGARGTGLGLAIVKHVVTAAGGSVEASGALGKGLTIRCRFPAS